MNKLFAFLFLFFSLNFCYAEIPNNNESQQKEFIFGFDTGILGIGFSYTIENNFAFEFTANLANFYIENTTTCIGIEFIPLNYSYSSHSKEHILSFTKFYLYWNIYELLTKNHPYKGILWLDGGNNDRGTFGPFFSIQAINLTNFENFNTNICYSAGIRITKKSLFKDSNIISIYSSNMEIGYKYLNNKRYCA